MTEIMHADIFFFITAVAVVAITIGMLIILYYLIPVARDLRAIVAKIRKAGDEVEKDFESLRANLHEEGAKSKMLVDLALGFIARKLTPSASKRSKKKPEEPPK